MMMAMVAVMAIIPSSDAADQAYDVDLGKKYSLQTQLIWDGKDAESILYEFSDGTSSTEWNPLKTWPAPGVYYITQTATNSYNGGSSTTAVYKVEIMGYPEIFFEENGGTEVADIEQTKFNVVATQPEDPTREGYTFTGWFVDEACTEIYDWSQGVKKDMTLYAGWEGSDPPVDPDKPSEDDNDSDGFKIDTWMIILVILIVIGIVAVLYMRG